MPTLSYPERRGEIEHYFDRTALDAWKKLTSDAPVSGIRATVRAGRDRMRTRLSSWLPEDLSGRRVLDAGLRYGCPRNGTGRTRRGSGRGSICHRRWSRSLRSGPRI